MDITARYLSQFIETIRPKDIKIRKQIDFGFTWENNNAILFEIRPKWNNPDEITQIEFAKMRYYKSRNEWQLYWMRGTGKWELYAPFPISNHLEDLFNIIRKDERNCFFG